MTSHEARMFCTDPVIWVPCVADDSGTIVQRPDLGLWLDREKAESIAMTHAPHMVHYRATCTRCSGTGWRNPSPDSTDYGFACMECRGTGQVWSRRT